MTPKEKAIELVNKFESISVKVDDFDLRNMSLLSAKECALICVDLLILENETIENIVNDGLFSTYWKEVKQEIEKL